MLENSAPASSDESGKNMPDSGKFNEEYREIKKVLRRQNLATLAKENDNPGDWYGLDRSDASEYFDTSPWWRKEIQNYFKSLHVLGEKIVYVDICGRATGEKLGVDQSYSFSLQAPENKEGSSAHFVSGSILKSTDFSKFLKKVMEGGVAPALVTFQPVLGLIQYNSEGRVYVNYPPRYDEVTYAQFTKRLEDVVRIVKPGGYVQFSLPFVRSEGVEIFIEGARQLAKKLKCEIELDNENSSDPYFLLHKLETWVK